MAKELRLVQRTLQDADSADSSHVSYHEKITGGSQNFMRLGDLLTQLQPNEKIIVTNKSEGENLRMTWIGSLDGAVKQKLIIVEVTGGM